MTATGKSSIAAPATSIIVFAHGSTVQEANDGVAQLAATVALRSGVPARAAFLDLARPDLAAAVSLAVSSGARRIVIVPFFLTLGAHMREDLPKLVKDQRAAHPGVEIVVGEALEGHPALAEMLLDRVREALAAPSTPAANGKA